MNSLGASARGPFLVDVRGEVVGCVTATDMPGLVDVHRVDGSELRDLTMSQVLDVCRREGWQLRIAAGCASVPRP